MEIERACTSMLVGKKASIDGSVMIARNDDTFLPLTPQRFYMHPAWHNKKGQILKSWLNGFETELPADGYRYNAVPNVDYKKEGYYEESGINEKNVAMSATESTYGNERTLAYDPLVKDGLDEDCIVNATLPFIDSARQAVQYLGKLITKYGSPAGNSVLFADKNEAWYMEIVTGHLWLAQRIPDDAYAVVANEVAIQEVDFNDTDNFQWADGIREFVDEHHLNPDKNGWNLRHIFGTFNEKDRHYNTPRVWYGHNLFNPGSENNPENGEMPFIMHADHKITPDEIEFYLGSHYNETKFDPLGHGDEADKLRYRPIGLNRTQNSHVLQLRNDVPEELQGLMYLCIGFPSFTPYVPFYTNANDTDPSYSSTPLEMDIDANSAYWMYRHLSMLVESHYSNFIQDDLDYLKACRQQQRTLLAQFDKEAADKHGEELTAFLTQKNYEMVADMTKRTKALINKLIMKGIQLSKLTFNMDKNL